MRERHPRAIVAGAQVVADGAEIAIPTLSDEDLDDLMREADRLLALVEGELAKRKTAG